MKLDKANLGTRIAYTKDIRFMRGTNMINNGLIVISHGYFAQDAINSVVMIMGKQEKAVGISLLPGESLDGLRDKIGDAIDRLGDCKSIIIIFDMLGGTPSNASITYALKRDDIKIISGLNIPMLVEFFNHRDLSAEELVENIIGIGKQSIIDVGDMISKHEENAG
jgi:PTS system mannose-specific IIA component